MYSTLFKQNKISLSINNIKNQTIFNLKNKHSINILKLIFKDKSHTFIFLNAKITLKELLKKNIELTRVICIKTLILILKKIIYKDTETTQNSFNKTNNITKLFNIYLFKIKKKLLKLAQLENLLIPILASMENHGLYINKISWINVIKKTAHKIKHYKKNYKTTNTYGTFFLKHINKQTNRIYASFKPFGTITGRFSCHNPNLQNFPSNKSFHKCICAPPQKIIITADYDNFELRILAGLSNDRNFIQAFKINKDLHSIVAEKLFKKTVNKTKNIYLRKKAKIINFGLIYGISVQGLSKKLNIPFPQAKSLFNKYFIQYPQIQKYLNNCFIQAIKLGYTETVLGRKLYFSNKKITKIISNSQIARIAKNMTIQGSGADIIKLALIKTFNKILKRYKDAFIVNTVHDEIIVECKKEDSKEIAFLIQKEMILAQSNLIPNIKPSASIKIGNYWK